MFLRSLVLFVLVGALSWAQSPVDRLVAGLDSLGSLRYDGWQCSPDLKAYRPTGNPALPGFDDSAWPPIRLRSELNSDSVWLRKTIVLPRTVLGMPVEGKVRLLVSVDDYGYLWVNGESRGFFPWDGDFVLTDSARPGQLFTLAVKAMNTGGPLRLLRAELVLEGASPLRQKILDLALSLKVGQKLLSHDSYQTNARRRIDPGIDKTTIPREEKDALRRDFEAAVDAFDIDVLRSPVMDRIASAIDSLRARLAPVAAFAKRFTLTFVANAHIDAAWLWRERETKDVCRATFSSVFSIMRAKPGFTYTQSSAQYYAWMETMYPDIFRGIQERIQQGRWEPIGGMWVEPDCNMPSGESWMRQLQFGKRYFRKKLGVNITTGWNPDSFGYHGNMPAFFQHAGIDAFITQKIGWNETNVFPYRVFWWEAPGGDRVLSYFPFDYVNSVEDPFRLVDWLRQFEANTGYRNLLVLFGVGDHGGGPSMEMIDRIERLRTLDIFPTIAYTSAQEYLNWLKTQNLDALPVWKDELYLEYHQGTFTTQAKTKQANRRMEELLSDAEKLASLAWLQGSAWPGPALATAWEGTLLNQFHDILPGSSIREVYIDAAREYERTERWGTAVREQALSTLLSSVDTRVPPGWTPLVVVNTLSWTRTDVVHLTRPLLEQGDFEILDPLGKPVISQRVQRNDLGTDLIFVASNVPAFGVAVYAMRPVRSLPGTSTVPAAGASLGNRRYVVDVDTSTGWIRSILDRATDSNVLKGPGNELQLLEDVPAQWDAWNIGLTGLKYKTRFEGYEMVEHGPVRSVLRLTHSFLKPGVTKDFPTENFPTSFFTQDIVLYSELDRIDFRTAVDWWENKTMVKVAFPFAVRDTVVRSEIPYGMITRPWSPRTALERGKTEIPTLRWIDATKDGQGLSLLTRSTYGFDIAGDALRISLLRAPRWPDATADRGMQEFHYALIPRGRATGMSEVAREGYAFSTPLMAVPTTRHPGKFGKISSFVSVSPISCLVPTITKSEEDAALVLDVVNIEGKDAIAELRFPLPVLKAGRVNAMEEAKGAVEITSSTIRVSVPARGFTTVKVWFRRK